MQSLFNRYICKLARLLHVDTDSYFNDMQKYKSTPRYFLSKLYILLAKTSAISGPAYKSIKSLEDGMYALIYIFLYCCMFINTSGLHKYLEYFCFIEKFKISEASYKEDISM